MKGSETVCKNLHSRLHSAVKQCQVQFGGKSEVATEQDECVQTLLCEWESVLGHGLKQRGISLIGFIGKGTKEDDRLWRFLKETLSVDDVRRLQSLSQVKTGMGLVRAWLRTALNERTLENSLTQLLREDKLSSYYEPEAFVCDQECSSTLPVMAAGLNSIIFALPLDDGALDQELHPTTLTDQEHTTNKVLMDPVDNEFRVVSVLKKTKRRMRPVTEDKGEDVEDSGSVSSSQHSYTSYDDCDTSSPRPPGQLGLCSSYNTKSCDELLEEAYDATKYVLGLGTQSLSEELREQQGGNHSADELRQALLSVISQKEILEQQCAECKDQLVQEQQQSSLLREEVSQLKEQMEQIEVGNKTRMEEIERENDVLRDQLKHYVTMLQTQQDPRKEEDGESTKFTQYETQMQSKLSEMANMHGEVMELNNQLHRQLQEKENVIRAMNKKLSQKTQSPQKVYSSPEKCPVYVWVPSVIKRTENGENYHVYQILVRVHKDEWNVYRRYSEFREFHKALQKDIPELLQFSFPPKKALASKSPEILEDRRLRLQEFLRTVIRLCSQSKMLNGKKMSAFITPTTTKSKLIKLLPFLTETVLSPQQTTEQVSVNDYSGL